ncbi:MAG TPA: hypothetical protein VFF13_03595 [archaeon]|nr:hypothetical protein [archaeon]
MKTKQKEFTQEQKKELAKFSYAFTLLKLIPIFLMLIFLGVLGVKLKQVSIETALILIAGALIAIYLLLPAMAGKVTNGIMAMKSKKTVNTK